MKAIEKIRRERHITQAALAEAVNVSQPFIHDLENGNRNAKPETWERIAAALGCTVDELLDKRDASVSKD